MHLIQNIIPQNDESCKFFCKKKPPLRLRVREALKARKFKVFSTYFFESHIAMIVKSEHRDVIKLRCLADKGINLVADGAKKLLGTYVRIAV